MPDAAIDEQRIVAARRTVGHRARRRMRELIAGADHVIIEAEFVVELARGRRKHRILRWARRRRRYTRQRSSVDHPFHRKIQLANRLADVLGVFLLHPSLGDLVGNVNPQHAAFRSIERRPRYPVFIGARTDPGGQPSLDLLPRVGQCDHFTGHSILRHTTFPTGFPPSVENLPCLTDSVLESSLLGRGREVLFRPANRLSRNSRIAQKIRVQYISYRILTPSLSITYRDSNKTLNII